MSRLNMLRFVRFGNGPQKVETHLNVDQFLRIEQGERKAILNGEEYEIKDGTTIVVPRGQSII